MKSFLYSLLFIILIIGAAEFSNMNGQVINIKTTWSLDTTKNIVPPNTPSVDEKTAVEKKDAPQFSDTLEMKIYSLTEEAVQLEPKKTKSDYIMPVYIGSCEMNSLVMARSGIAPARPMSYELMTNIFAATNVRMKSMVISKLQNNTYYATIVLNDNGKVIGVDARPSDAMNLALRNNVPIYCERAVFNEAKEKKQ